LCNKKPVIMKKITVITVCLFVLFSIPSQAQFSVGAGGGMFKYVDDDIDYDAQFGPQVSLYYDVSEVMRVGVNWGYYLDSENDFTLFSMPIVGAFEYKFAADGIDPYAGFNVGTVVDGWRYDGESDSEVNFALGPVAGVDFEISDMIVLNGNFKYNLVFYEDWEGDTDTQGAISFNVGVLFKF